VTKLASPSEKQREDALVALQNRPAEAVVPEIVRLLLVESSSEVQAACLDLLERFGAAIDLRGARADDWFENICDQIQGVRAICDVMGARFLAYSMILGLQIRSLGRDPHVPANTTVEFESGEGGPQALTLGEFKLRAVQALLGRKHDPPTVALPLEDEDAVRLIGSTALLLAPLFQLKIENVIVSPEVPQRVVVGFVSQVGLGYLDLPAFEALIHQLVMGDLRGASEEPFQLDLNAVETARAAAVRGDYAGVIRVLENWPGILAALQRTQVAKRLNPQQMALIGEGLLLLGEAFEIQGRILWSEELYRLGLQLLREQQPSPELFFRLGALLVGSERYGEAIGLLRHAHAAGVDGKTVFPPLGKALLKRERKVAAALLLSQARSLGAKDDDLEADLAELARLAEEAGTPWLLG